VDIPRSVKPDGLGEPTRHYWVGEDQLLKNAEAASKISTQDWAAAMLDELEHRQHIRERFTVAC
jgi:hypothetical protein